MTDQERKLILELATKEFPRDDFLKLVRSSSDGKTLALTLLNEALHERVAVDVEYALIVGFVFGFSKAHLGALIQLANEDWHFKHEDVVTALSEIGDPQAIEALYRATQVVPPYLEFDETRALARKAIWALGDLPGTASEEKLRLLSESDDSIVREQALKQLRRRAGLEED